MNLRMDSGSISILEKGNDFTRYKAILAKPGVLVYGDSKEFLSKEELFHPDTIKSFNGLPFSVEHPASGMTSENWKEHTVGSIYDPHPENGVLVGNIIVYDREANRAIENGEISEISIARVAETIPVQGEYNGESYNAVQTRIRGNHVALTKKGRAGETVRIVSRVDSKIGEKFMKYRADSDGKDHEIPEAVDKDISVLKAKVKEMEETLKKEMELKASLEKKVSELGKPVDTSEKEKLEKQILELETRVKLASDETGAWKKKFDELENKVPEIVETQVQERAAVFEQAKVLLGDSVDFARLPVDKIKDEVIGKFLPYPEGLKMDSVNSDMRNARYDAAIDLAKKQIEIDPKLGRGVRQDSEDYRQSMYGKKQGE